MSHTIQVIFESPANTSCIISFVCRHAEYYSICNLVIISNPKHHFAHFLGAFDSVSSPSILQPPLVPSYFLTLSSPHRTKYSCLHSFYFFKMMFLYTSIIPFFTFSQSLYFIYIKPFFSRFYANKQSTLTIQLMINLLMDKVIFTA